MISFSVVVRTYSTVQALLDGTLVEKMKFTYGSLDKGG